MLRSSPRIPWPIAPFFTPAGASCAARVRPRPRQRCSSSEDGDLTVAVIKTDVKLSGRAASMGQGVIGEVSKKLVDTFSINLAGMLVPATPAPADDGAGPGAARATPAAAPFVPSDDASLPVLSVIGSVVMDRLRKPRVGPVGSPSPPSPPW